MERLTAIAPNGMAYLVKVKPSEQDVESPYPNTLNCVLESFKRLAAYEDTGLTPEEITKLHTLIEQQGKELNRRDQLIRELDEKCDYWELEAKKYCAVLGEQKIKIQQLECEMCRPEDTEECKQC